MSRNKSISNIPDGLNKKKHRTAISFSTTNVEKLEKIKKSLFKTSIFTSPYASKEACSLQLLDKIKFKPKIKPVKKYFRTFVKPAQSVDICEKKTFGTSASFLSSEEVNKSENKDKLIKRIRKILEKIENPCDEEDKTRLQLCQAAFNEVIEYDKEFSVVLQIIKKEYEKGLKLQAEELDRKNQRIRELEKAKKHLTSDIKKTIIENKDLMDKYDELRESLSKISEKLLKIADFSTQDLDKTEENWNKLVQVNKLYEEELGQSKKETEYYRHKARKMIKILIMLEKKGFPVEDVYNDARRKKLSLPKYQGPEDTPNGTEYEYIISAKPKIVKKPKEIPILDMAGINNETVSGSDSYSLHSYSDF
ncbi:hypothetical protein SteCoe_28771 [Stentor coeruleus]|uniref:Uncharacterized protein n=1 Tax=Stentor coeruleus TaxID=5963 RepID=A0A1R2B7I2_9CILI|nr:hypothetical protein SteCoe_28771 [Stentor coeruleus]